METEQQIMAKFNKDISRVMDYISQGEEIQARYVFNTEMFKQYSNKIKPGGLLYFAAELWFSLDEYFNNEGARAIKSHSTDKNYLLSIYKDYQNDFKKIL